MQARSSAYTTYWRHSLADADTGRGALHTSDISAFRTLSQQPLAAGCADRDIVAACFDKEPEQLQVVEVVIRPKVYTLRLEHGRTKDTGTPAIVTPIVASALLARDGRMYPLNRTLIPRDLLEPLARGHFSIGGVSDQDAWLTAHPVPGIAFMGNDAEPLSDSEFNRQWADFLAGCDRLLEQIGGSWPGREAPYTLAEYGYLAKKESVSSKHILALYDHLHRHAPQVPLFERYASGDMSAPDPCLPPHAGFSQRLAHASHTFPLTRTQCDALAHLMAAQAGEILAVNGPPGTGKTTLLLSAVASLWAHAALTAGEPPVIVAASATNQAVTNIIDAFGHDFATGAGPFAGRWLPDIKSFGAFLPSIQKEAEVAAKYQTEAFFNAVESATYIAEAQQAYVRAAAAAFPEIAPESFSIQAAVDALREAIRKEAATLGALEEAWSALSRARDAVGVELGDTPAAVMTQRRRQLEETANEKQLLDELVTHWERYRAQESLVYAFFSWLPPVAQKRMRLARVFLKPIWPPHHAQDAWESIHQIDASLKSLSRQCHQAVQEHTWSVKRGEAVLDAERSCVAQWQAALAPLDLSDAASRVSIADCEARADTLIRFTIFLLTTHYWEGRWLLEMQALLPNLDEEKKKQGRSSIEKRWRRRMKLTPCIVSTFFTLPSKMQVSQHDGTGFVSHYLYDFADLLIVDEAGQVLPDVAGASFALSKKALIIGDHMQIEPIWSVPASIDIGNLVSAKLLPEKGDQEAYERLCKTGTSAASGSVMQIAQTLSRYHYDPALARGLFLYEHHRCFDEIVSYCNALCYRGKLIPKRGSKAAAANKGDAWPALGYLHIDGMCQQRSGGSRHNIHEADTIAAWLAKHRDALETDYAQPLHHIVGIVTPFSAQVDAISQACRHAGIPAGSDKEGITIGTVHSLQGAQRAVVIFSAVYSKHADGRFIDNRPSMLNVAVSRAKNTFLVFGDMDVFAAAPKTTPRGLLADYLFRDPDNALSFEHLVRKDLHALSTDLQVLREAPAHDAFLLETLKSVQRDIHIVSPWINQRRIEDIGAFKAMQDAVGRDVQITVYTDRGLNTDEGTSENKITQVLRAAGTLRNAGIEVNFVKQVHSKMVIGDDDVFCVGSFNWFSASRYWKYVRHETSFVYRGHGLADEREAMLNSLRQRVIDDPVQRSNSR